jgi:hypothetical protein
MAKHVRRAYARPIGRERTTDLKLRHVRDSSTGERGWEFACECGRRECSESVFLTLDAYAERRDAGHAVLAEGHPVNQIAVSRRLVEAARALRAQAEHQVRQARKNLGTG